MLHQDATAFFDLPEAGRLLFCDTVRLDREARARKIPSARVGGEVGLPEAWVEAAAGIAPVDEASVREYWLLRLSPPSRAARRPSLPRDRLPATALLDPAEAARRVLADPVRLERMDGDGTLPALRVEGRTAYDEELVRLVAEEDLGEEARRAAAARRALVRDWARYEYVAALEPARLPGAPPAPPRAAPRPETAPAPGAFEIPADLGLDEIPLPPPGRLSEAEGFETVDED